MLGQLGWVCLGGALGSGARLLVGLGLARLLGPGFPYGTLAVNLTGSFLLCLLMALALGGGGVPLHVRLFLTTGFMGGLTTYSTFTYETLMLLEQRAWALAALNLVGTLGGSLVAGLLGLWAGRALAGP